MGDKYLTYHLGNKHSIYIDTCVNDGDIYTKSRFSLFFFLMYGYLFVTDGS